MPAAAAIGAVGAAAIGAGASYLSGKSSANAAKKAAKQQAAAAQAGIDATLKMYETSRQDLKPYADAGKPAVDSILGMYGLKPGTAAFNDAALASFRASPDYEVAMREGVDALNNKYAARGELKSGRAMKGIMDYASDLGSATLEQYLNRLYSLAGMGQNAAARTGSNAMQTGSNVAQLELGRGEAQASGTIGAGNANAAMIGNIGELAAYALERNPSAYRTPSLY